MLIRSVMHHFLAEPDGKGAEKFLELTSPEGVSDFIRLPNINYKLAEKEGILCGVVAMHNHKHLQHLYIAPNFQGQGVGKHLWLSAKDEAIAAGNLGEFTVNGSLHAVPFYEKLGFVSDGVVQTNGGLIYQPMKMVSNIALA